MTDADELVKRLAFLKIVTDADTLKRIRVLAHAVTMDRQAHVPKPCSVGVNGGQKEVVLRFHTTADALTWSDALIAQAVERGVQSGGTA